MNFIKTDIQDCMIIEPKVFGDSRGYFFESFRKDVFAANGIATDFIQDNESKSHRGVLRGLHYQLAPFAQAKLVRVISGAVLDIAVDIRRSSPTFGRYVAAELTAENKRMLFVPRGFAHGFIVLKDETVFTYKCDNTYNPAHERGIAFDDPALGIDWNIPAAELLLSEKDTRHPLLADAEVFT